MSSSMTSTMHPYRAFSKLTQHRSSAALGSSRVVAPTPRVRIRARASSVVVRANWIKDAFFKSAEEKALAEFATSDAGKKAIEFAAANKGGGMDLILAFGKKEAVLQHVPTANSKSLIDTGTRTLLATLINGLIDIPIMSEANEQILALKAVDLIADYLEKEMRDRGIASFFEDVKSLSDKDLDKWVVKIATDINEKVDLPVLDEEQEQIVIELVLKLVAHKFVKGEKPFD